MFAVAEQMLQQRLEISLATCREFPTTSHARLRYQFICLQCLDGAMHAIPFRLACGIEPSGLACHLSLGPAGMLTDLPQDGILVGQPLFGLIGGKKFEVRYEGVLKLSYHGVPINVPVKYRDEVRIRF